MGTGRAPAEESMAFRVLGALNCIVPECTATSECGGGSHSNTSSRSSDSEDGPPMEILAERHSQMQEPRSRQRMRERHRRRNKGSTSTRTSSDGKEHQKQQPDHYLLSDMESLVRVQLRKPLGIVFDSIKDELNGLENSNHHSGLRISELPPMFAAYRSSRLEIGDELLSINGVDVSRRSFQYVSDFIRRTNPKSPLDIIFRRPSGVNHQTML